MNATKCLLTFRVKKSKMGTETVRTHRSERSEKAVKRKKKPNGKEIIKNSLLGTGLILFAVLIISSGKRFLETSRAAAQTGGAQTLQTRLVVLTREEEKSGPSLSDPAEAGPEAGTLPDAAQTLPADAPSTEAPPPAGSGTPADLTTPEPGTPPEPALPGTSPSGEAETTVTVPEPAVTLPEPSGWAPEPWQLETTTSPEQWTPEETTEPPVKADSPFREITSENLDEYVRWILNNKSGYSVSGIFNYLWKNYRYTWRPETDSRTMVIRVLNTGSACCYEYAETLCYLLHAAGHGAYHIRGQGREQDSHHWVIAEIEPGVWRHCDPLWKNSYIYGLTDAELKRLDNTAPNRDYIWDTEMYTSASPTGLGPKLTPPETEPTTEETEPTTEPTSEPDTEPVTEPDTEPESEPNTEPGSEPGTEPDTEPETEPTSEPDTEPGTEPDTEPDTEPWTEPDTEPDTEPVTEPDTEPETEPSTEPTIPTPAETEPSTEPTIPTPTETEPSTEPPIPTPAETEPSTEPPIPTPAETEPSTEPPAPAPDEGEP